MRTEYERSDRDVFWDVVYDMYGTGFSHIQAGDGNSSSHEDYQMIKERGDSFVIVREESNGTLYLEYYTFPSEIPAGISEEELVEKCQRAAELIGRPDQENLIELLDNYITKYLTCSESIHE